MAQETLTVLYSALLPKEPLYYPGLLHSPQTQGRGFFVSHSSKHSLHPSL